MKKISKIVCIIIMASVCFCTACSVASFETYTNGDKYSAGDTDITSKVEKIDISWSSGSVNIETHEENTVSIREDSGDIPEEMKVHWWLDGTTLRIKFCKSAAKFLLKNDKKLTVIIPENIGLEEIKLSCASAETVASLPKTEKAVFSSSSGKITLQCDAEKIELNSSSGKIDLVQKGKAQKIVIDTSSGNIKAEIEECEELQTDSSSGKTDISGKVIKELESDSSSGEIKLNLCFIPDESEIDSSSGNVELTVPKDGGFTLDFDTASGDLDYEISMKKSGGKYIYGDGKAKINVDTASGNLIIKEK